uniref:Putative secreted protein n=1 Tax=Anopheles darlingi TaxID=43151 RepID=A0A2M4DPI2_ANODA
MYQSGMRRLCRFVLTSLFVSSVRPADNCVAVVVAAAAGVRVHVHATQSHYSEMEIRRHGEEEYWEVLV